MWVHESVQLVCDFLTKSEGSSGVEKWNASQAKPASDFELTNAGDIKMQVALPISLESDA